MSTINGLGGNAAMIMQGMGRIHHPLDPSKMAAKLFSQIDTAGKGYIEESDLQKALQNVSSSQNGSSSTTVLNTSSISADDLFSALDSNSDGKVTQQEMSDSIKKLADAAASQRQQRAMGSTEGGGMPPPPPKDDAGFTKDQLQTQLNAVQQSGNTDTQRSKLLSSIVSNFDAADTNKDGKVSFQEAMAYQAHQKASSTSTTNTTANTTSTDSSTTNKETLMMKTVMQLMQTYGVFGQNAEQSKKTGLISEVA